MKTVTFFQHCMLCVVFINTCCYTPLQSVTHLYTNWGGCLKVQVWKPAVLMKDVQEAHLASSTSMPAGRENPFSPNPGPPLNCTPENMLPMISAGEAPLKESSKGGSPVVFGNPPCIPLGCPFTLLPGLERLLLTSTSSISSLSVLGESSSSSYCTWRLADVMLPTEPFRFAATTRTPSHSASH